MRQYYKSDKKRREETKKKKEWSKAGKTPEQAYERYDSTCRRRSAEYHKPGLEAYALK